MEISRLSPVTSSLLILLAAIGCSQMASNIITVTNDSAIDRIGEIVELTPVPAALLDSTSSFIIVDERGDEVPYQITHDDKLIFPACAEANSSSSYYIVEGQPQPRKLSLAYTVRPDCQDDFAWENEHSGYRLYGPSFKRGGGKVHGYDIWCKRNPEPIVDRFYSLDHGPEKISYHKDHGEGFDGYTVGPTLGAGANALVLDSTICYPTGYDKYEVLDNGLLRMTMRFTIDSIPFGAASDDEKRYITETRTVSLDRLSHFNKVSTVYSGVDSPTPIVAGIVVHADNPDGYHLYSADDAISVIDLSDDIKAGNGEIYVGAIVPGADSLLFSRFDEVKANAVGQALAASRYVPGQPFTYYWGSGWSKGSVADSAQWHRAISKKSIEITHPLKASYGK